MSFIVKKKINGSEYYYLRESVREKGKVKAKTIAYLGKDKKEAERKMEEIVNNKVNKASLENNKMEDKSVKITYFVHGTTADNDTGVSSGQNQGELTELGIKQSKGLPKQIKEKDFDVVFCSDLKRAIDSAELSFKGKYKIIQDKRLRECNYGKFNTYPSKIVEPMQEKCIRKKFPKGESYEDVKKRISSFLKFLKKDYQGKHIAIVAHKAPQLALDVLLKGKTWKQAFAEDWRKRKAWQPGWEYTLR